MWLYKGKEIKELSDMPGDPFGFIYVVTHTPTGRKYLGKKQLMSVQKKALGKKELALITDGRASKKKTDRFAVCGNTTSHTAANAYPRIDIRTTHINEWLVQSDKSLELESVPNSTGDPEFKNIESVCGNNGEPMSIKSRCPLPAIS